MVVINRWLAGLVYQFESFKNCKILIIILLNEIEAMLALIQTKSKSKEEFLFLRDTNEFTQN